MKSDIEIAKSAELQDIYTIAENAGIKKEEVIPMGWKTPMETKLVILGVGNRNSEQECV